MQGDGTVPSAATPVGQLQDSTRGVGQLLQTTESESREGYRLHLSLSSFKETFKVQLQKEQEKALNEIVLLRSSFKATGPHRADMPIAVALRECQEIDERIEQIELEEQRLKAAYRIFQLDMAMSQELPHVKKVHVHVRDNRTESFV